MLREVLVNNKDQNKQVDNKQYMAYQTICDIFLLSVIYECYHTANALAYCDMFHIHEQNTGCNTKQRRHSRNLIKRLKILGGNRVNLSCFSGKGLCLENALPWAEHSFSIFGSVRQWKFHLMTRLLT